MSEENKQSSMDRRKRVNRLKGIILLCWVLLTVIPIACCISLSGKMKRMNRTYQELDGKLDELYTLLEQRDEVAASRMTTLGTGGMEQMPLNTRREDTRTGVLDKGEIAHRVYLTFDDGPSTYTDEILDILKQYGVKATFFVVGKEDDHSREMLQRIVEEGHTLGMHSYSHQYGEIYASEESFVTDFHKIQDYLMEVTGVQSRVYRFPGGSSNAVSKVPMEQLIAYLDSQNVVYYDWNASAQDAISNRLTVQQVVRNCTKSIGEQETSIILLHDASDKRVTVEALPMLIETLLEMEDTVILPISEETEPIQHISPVPNIGMEE